MELRESVVRRPPPTKRSFTVQTWAGRLLCVGLLGMHSACSSVQDEPLFTLLSPEETGIAFINTVVEQEGFNVLEYEYFYNGAGVAVGDIDNDGLPDIYFSANMTPDRLFLNRGDLQFEDISERAGLQSDAAWTTGVTMVDVNDDGWLDIYVCRSGNVAPERRRNALYLNQGDLTFTESAADFGLDAPAYSNHAAFFDYDRDGDLDAFLLNHSIRRYSRFVVEYMRSQRDSLAGDKLLRNDDGIFRDVSEEAGIIGNPLGFGLSAIVSDINQDGWPDIFVSNDYIEDDYLYINLQDGAFSESIRSYLSHTSYSSMGADIADINNDGLPEILTLDMLAEDNYRQKILKGPEDHVFYAQMRADGFHEQYMRNMLQVNSGGSFIEIGQLAGISNTDWSWAALMADFDLDGYKDIFITNGYMRDYTNLDFLKTTLVESYKEASARGEALSSLDMVRRMPSTRLKNYIFRNESDLTFSNQTTAWGMDQPTLSNGAAYADLDADGDLDLIVNNINQPAFLYRNNAGGTPGSHYLKVTLEGPPGNRWGIGAKVELAGEGQRFYQEMVPGRGYLSSVEPQLIFGLGLLESVDVVITWPDGQREVIADTRTDQTLNLTYAEASASLEQEVNAHDRSFTPVSVPGLAFRHQENPFVDFDREPLMPHMLSREGPALSHGDINQDGLEDVFVGGARGQEARLFLQQIDGSFQTAPSAALVEDSPYEDVDALFFDYDNDLDLDLYVVSGGNSAEEGSMSYQDRLYVNEGFGRLARRPDALPPMHTSGASVAAHDYDEDGDIDLFVGGRVRPGGYPLAPRSYLLENTGEGFRDVTARDAPGLVVAGMVTDALWADIDGDSGAELVVVGEWMSIRVFERAEGGAFAEISDRLGLANMHGYWNTIKADDLDGDGDIDLVAGARGLNTQAKVSFAEPASIYAADFDYSGSLDAVISVFNLGREVPVNSRDQLLAQLPSLQGQFSTYASFAEATLHEVLTEDDRSRAEHLRMFVAETSIFEKTESGAFVRASLPLAAQVAPVRDILLADFNGDEHKDLLLAGNNYGVRAEDGRDAAGRGLLLTGEGTLSYRADPHSGFFAPYDARKISLVSTPRGPLVLVANNDDRLEVFALTHPQSR